MVVEFPALTSSMARTGLVEFRNRVLGVLVQKSAMLGFGLDNSSRRIRTTFSYIVIDLQHHDDYHSLALCGLAPASSYWSL